MSERSIVLEEKRMRGNLTNPGREQREEVDRNIVMITWDF